MNGTKLDPGAGQIHIRRGTRADDTLLAEMGRRTFSAAFGADNRPEDMAQYLAGAFSPEIQARELADPRSTFLIAEIGGEAAGYARLLLGPHPPAVTGRLPVELVRIYAEPAWIGHGVGSALMAACLERAAELGCDAIWLGVWQRNPRAIAFYRSWDFEVVGTQTFLLGTDPQDDFIMARPIEA